MKAWLRGVVLAMAGLAAPRAASVDLGTHNGCAASDADFKVALLAQTPVPPGSQEPHSNTILKIAFARNADGPVDVYFVQKWGTVKRYNGRTGTVDSLGHIDVEYDYDEDGLIGIGIRRDFGREPWLYFTYTATERPRRDSISFSFRISRIKLTADRSGLDMPTEQVLLRIDRIKGWNVGGAMRFDAYDDLWVAIGDDMVTEKGAGNTADLRGGILRIHPDASAKGYSVPPGNFAERFRAYYAARGDSALAAAYADTARARPELYVKGTDHAFSMYVDPVRRWLAWGDIGPDQGKVSEEYDLVKEPVFAGWPYFAGEEDMTGIAAYSSAGPIPAGSTRSLPVNSLGLGVGTLPPNVDPLFARRQGCAITGPIFRYDGSLPDSGQMPPQFDRKWLVTGCDGYGWHLLTLDSLGSKVVSQQAIWAGIRPSTLIDAEQGPDGALYFVDYGKGTLNKIEYTGSCKDPALLPEKTGCADPAARNYDPGLPKAFHDPRLCEGAADIVRAPSRAAWFAVDGRSVRVSAPGTHRLEFRDLRGRVVAALSAPGPASHPLPSLPAGVYLLRAHSSLGPVETAFAHLGP